MWDGEYDEDYTKSQMACVSSSGHQRKSCARPNDSKKVELYDVSLIFDGFMLPKKAFIENVLSIFCIELVVFNL